MHFFYFFSLFLPRIEFFYQLYNLFRTILCFRCAQAKNRSLQEEAIACRNLFLESRKWWHFFPPPRTCQVTKNMEQVARECENAKCSAFCNKILIETQFRMITSNFGMNYKEKRATTTTTRKKIASKFIFVRIVIYCRLFCANEHGPALDMFPLIHHSRQHNSIAIRKRHAVQFSM